MLTQSSGTARRPTRDFSTGFPGFSTRARLEHASSNAVFQPFRGAGPDENVAPTNGPGAEAPAFLPVYDSLPPALTNVHQYSEQWQPTVQPQNDMASASSGEHPGYGIADMNGGCCSQNQLPTWPRPASATGHTSRAGTDRDNVRARPRACENCHKRKVKVWRETHCRLSLFCQS